MYSADKFAATETENHFQFFKKNEEVGGTLLTLKRESNFKNTCLCRQAG
jgi:hypothetical protein